MSFFFKNIINKVDVKFLAITTLPFILISICTILIGASYVNNVTFKRVVLLLILTPIVEEYIFRGFIQRKILSKSDRGIFKLSYANIFTSLLFAAVHLFSKGILLSLLTFIPSLIFGLSYERRMSIVTPAIIHSIYNISAFIFYI